MTRLVLALALVAAVSAPAAAQAPDAATLEASGNKHFQLAEYDAAIADFKEAFRISDAPGYLFNIAQSYRLKGDCRNAATFYKNFLRRVPDAPNAAKVRTWITEQEACAAKQPEPAPTPAPVPTPTPTPTPAPTTATSSSPALEQPEPEDRPPPASNRAWMKYAGFAGIGVGVIGLGLGAKFMLDGKSANKDLETACAVTCTSAEALAIQDRGKSANRNAVIASVAGGAVAAAGIVLVVLSMSGGTEPHAAVAITPTGASASYAWRF